MVRFILEERNHMYPLLSVKTGESWDWKQRWASRGMLWVFSNGFSYFCIFSNENISCRGAESMFYIFQLIACSIWLTTHSRCTMVSYRVVWVVSLSEAMEPAAAGSWMQVCLGMRRDIRTGCRQVRETRIWGWGPSVKLVLVSPSLQND